MEQILFVMPSQQALCETVKQVCSEMGLAIPVETPANQQAMEELLQDY